jgi:hypothetical protein
MKVVTQITILDNNNNIVFQDSEDQTYVQGQDMDIEYEIVHDNGGGSHMRPKHPPKY